MRAIMRRLETGDRWWTAEIAFRAFGLGLLGVCAGAALRLYHSVNQLPQHLPTAVEIVVAAIAVICWALGWAFLVEGPGLFKLIEVPARRWTL